MTKPPDVATANPGSVGSFRLRPEHYQPARVPPDVVHYGQIPDTLAVGSPGKIGILDLSLEQVDGRTQLVDHYQKSPLQIMRPLYFDQHRPDLAVIFLMSTGGGVIQADRLRTDLRCGQSTATLFTTQAATKLHSMEFDYATHQINLVAEANSYVEFLPEPVIPHARSRFYQHTCLTVDPTATVLINDSFYAGRLGHGERHDFDILAADLEIRSSTGQLLAIDTIRFEPARHSMTSPVVLSNQDLMASFYAVSPLASPKQIADAMHSALADSNVLYGVSILPHDCGAWVRIVVSHPPVLTAALRAVWEAVRVLLIGVPPPELRKP